MTDTYKLTCEGYVLRSDGARISTYDTPESPNTNPDYLAYRQFRAEGGVPLPADLPPIEQRRAAAWEGIKAERDRRKGLGVKVGANWFHSDPGSRIQQIGLTKFIPWHGLENALIRAATGLRAHDPELADAIVQATAISDVAIFTAAEVHRMAMEASAAPQDYDFSTGWPVSIEEEAFDAGIQFNAAAAA